MRRLLWALLAVTCSGASATRLAGQVILEAPALCTACERTISPSDRTIPAAEPVDVAHDQRGRTWIVQGALGVVEVFGSELSAPVEVGRRGQGPREFMGPSALIPQGDSMWVADAPNRRMTLVGPDLVVARSVPFPGAVFDGVVVSDSVAFLNAIVSTEDGAGHPLHLVDLRTGEVIRSFGGPSDPSSRAVSASRLLASVVSFDKGSALLVAFRSSPLLQLWTPQGALVREWEMEARWFRSVGLSTLGTPSVRPNPVTSVVVPIDDQKIGLGLWLVRDDWEDAWKGVDQTATEVAASEVPPPETLWRGAWVEVDLDAGEVTYAGALPFLPRYAVGGEVLQYEDAFDSRLRFWSRVR